METKTKQGRAKPSQKDLVQPWCVRARGWVREWALSRWHKSRNGCDVSNWAIIEVKIS